MNLGAVIVCVGPCGATADYQAKSCPFGMTWAPIISTRVCFGLRINVIERNSRI